MNEQGKGGWGPFAAELKTWEPPRYRWRVNYVFAKELEGWLNTLVETDWEVFSILPSTMTPHQIVVVSRQPQDSE